MVIDKIKNKIKNRKDLNRKIIINLLKIIITDNN
jgi:hypothetical protein